MLLTLVATAQAQMPTPALPRVYINTTFNAPVGGQTWHPQTSATLTSTLVSAMPGDTIVLNAGATYSGTFTLPMKNNPNGQWIYIVSSALASLPAPGTRVGPANAANMPKLTTTTAVAPITLAAGANHWRLVGLEVTSNSTRGCNNTTTPTVNCFSYSLVTTVNWPSPLPDSITVDRCYLHGSDTQDVGEGVAANGSNFAVVDSYISDIHESTNDSQAILVYWTPGPIKIVNNYLSATTEDVMFGGVMAPNLPYIPSDIEIRNNLFFKPLAWDQTGITIGWPKKWDVKNNLEFKDAQRAIVTGNTMQNVWASGQTGSSVLFTPRATGAGSIALVDDITFQNNVITNADSGFQTLASDYNCATEPGCTFPGEAKRIVIDNNLLLLNPEKTGTNHFGLLLTVGMSDFVFEHNTVLMSDQSPCWNSIYFGLSSGSTWPPTTSPTHNVWILNNALCRQPTGDWSGQGMAGLNGYMSDPAPVAPRFLGNVMYVPSGNNVQQWPAHNYATTVPFVYTNPNLQNYQLLTPDWMDTSDGQEAGINNFTSNKPPVIAKPTTSILAGTINSAASTKPVPTTSAPAPTKAGF